jgi:hypothetical protein
LENRLPSRKLFLQPPALGQNGEYKVWLASVPEIRLDDMKLLKSELKIPFSVALATAVATALRNHVRKYGYGSDQAKWMKGILVAPKNFNAETVHRNY